MAYTKLFQKILASSIWNEDMATRLVWITLLCMKDQNHIVQGSVGGIAHMARVPIEDCRRALDKLEGPDPDDSSGVADGRRIERLDRGGWLVINGAPYRDAKDEDERRAYMANYMRQYRARKSEERKQSVNSCEQELNEVTSVNPSDQIRSEREREEPKKSHYAAEIPKSLRTPEFEKAWSEWFEYQSDGRRSANWNHASQRRDLVYLERLGVERACQSIDHTMGGKLDRLEEALELGRGANGISLPGTQNGANHFITREGVEAWCKKNNCFKIVDRVWGAVMGGKFYGARITNETDLRSAMENVKAQWLKEP